MKNKIYLGLGSNAGDRAENITSALSFLQSSGLAAVKKISSLYETSPIGPKQRSFYNAVAEAETALAPKDLLALVKQAERLLGRRVSKRWGPRIIDIDILFYGQSIVKIKNLTIPHAQILKRLFTLMPMNEIAPDFVHPTLNRKINAILNENLLTLADQKVKIIKNEQEDSIHNHPKKAR